MDLNRMRELAGLQEKNFRPKEIDSMSKEELVALKETLEVRIARTFILAETKFSDQLKLKSVNEQLKKLEDQIDEHLEEVNGKWALVSKKTGKPLRYYKGEGKPSTEWVSKQEKSIQYFKNGMGESSEADLDKHLADLVDDTELVTEIQEAATPGEATPPTDTVPVISYADEDHADNNKETEERLGQAQDENTKVKLPAGLMNGVEKRIAELKKSIEEFDKEEFKIHYHNKQKAIDCLEFIKEKLNMGNMLGFKQAIIFYGTVASFISEMFPAKLIMFLHTGMEQKKEVPTNSFADGDADKLKEKDIPDQASVPATDTSIYPQIAKSKNVPD